MGRPALQSVFLDKAATLGALAWSAKVRSKGAPVLARSCAVQRVARRGGSWVGLSVCQLLLRVGATGNRLPIFSACSRQRDAGAQSARVCPQLQVHGMGR